MAVDDRDPATLMPLETPLLKVSRPVAACSRCRNAKIKCDGKLPGQCAGFPRQSVPLNLCSMLFMREERAGGGVYQH